MAMEGKTLRKGRFYDESGKCQEKCWSSHNPLSGWTFLKEFSLIAYICLCLSSISLLCVSVIVCCVVMYVTQHPDSAVHSIIFSIVTAVPACSQFGDHHHVMPWLHVKYM